MENLGDGKIIDEEGKPIAERYCLSAELLAQPRAIRFDVSLSSASLDLDRMLWKGKKKEKPPLEELPEVLKLVQAAEGELNGAGRVLLRYSGTEPKIRLLIEGRDGARINAQADQIAAAIQTRIGE